MVTADGCNPNVVPPTNKARIRVPPSHFNRTSLRPPAHGIQNSIWTHENHPHENSTTFSLNPTRARSSSHTYKFDNLDSFQSSTSPVHQFSTTPQWLSSHTNQGHHTKAQDSTWRFLNAPVPGKYSKEMSQQRAVSHEAAPPFEQVSHDIWQNCRQEFLPENTFEVKWGGESLRSRSTLTDAASDFDGWVQKREVDNQGPVPSPPIRPPPRVSASDSAYHTDFQDTLNENEKNSSPILMPSEYGHFGSIRKEPRQRGWVFPQLEKKAKLFHQESNTPATTHPGLQMSGFVSDSRYPWMTVSDSPSKSVEMLETSPCHVVQSHGGLARFQSRPTLHSQPDGSLKTSKRSSCLTFQTWRGQQQGKNQIQKSDEKDTNFPCEDNTAELKTKSCNGSTKTSDDDKVDRVEDEQDEIFHPLEKHPCYIMPNWLTAYNIGVKVNLRNQPSRKAPLLTSNPRR